MRLENPPARARTDAVNMVIKARTLSGVLFALTATGAAACYQVFGAPALAGLLVVGAAVLVSPLGTLLSAWTLWAGRWVSSCPNCPSFVVRRLEPEYFECDACGESGVKLAPVASDLALRRESDDTHVCRGCAQ